MADDGDGSASTVVHTDKLTFDTLLLLLNELQAPGSRASY